MEETNNTSIENIIKNIQEFMIDHNLTMSTAESCTAGRLASMLTSNDGSSKYFIGGLVCYQNNIKSMFLSVKSRTIKEHDVVSREVANEMVRGCVSTFGTNCGIAVTGYASKSNNPNIPNGTIYAAFNVNGCTSIKKYQLNGNRLDNLKNVSDYIIKDFYDYLIYNFYSK